MLKLIHKDIGDEKKIIEWLEFMKYSESIVIGEIQITKWVQTYEIGTREGNKQNSLSTDDLEEVAKRIIKENKLLTNKAKELEELEKLEAEEAYMSPLNSLFSYHPVKNKLGHP